MNDFSFRMLTKVKFGIGLIEKVGEECLWLNARKAFIITGRTATKNGEFLVRLIHSLDAQGISHTVYSEIEPDPGIGTIDHTAAVLRDSGADIVIAIGGGSPMDAAKAVAILQTNEGSVRDYLYGIRHITHPSMPLICIPTTAGTGSEVTAAAVITDTENEYKAAFSHDYMMPALAIIDPGIHIGMPAAITSSTGMDALTHAIEAYVSLNAEPVSDALALEAIRLIGENIEKACSEPENIEVRSNMALASLMAGAAFANAGVGAVHGIAHALGAHCHLSHGVANAVMLPYVMDKNLPGNYSKYARIAEILGEDTHGLSTIQAAEKSMDAVRKLSRQINVPTKLKPLGVKTDDFPSIIEDTMMFRLMAINPRRLEAEDIQEILEEAFEWTHIK